MKHQRLDHLSARADVLPVTGRSLSRRQRLNRWGELLMRAPDEPLTALKWIEFHAGPERARMRAPGSPVGVAYADPALRSAGLGGDTLGDAETFFGLSGGETHFLLCDCHYRGGMNGRGVARRLWILGLPRMLRNAWMSVLAP
jgi:hypothetical protein